MTATYTASLIVNTCQVTATRTIVSGMPAPPFTFDDNCQNKNGKRGSLEGVALVVEVDDFGSAALLDAAIDVKTTTRGASPGSSSHLSSAT